MEVTQTKAEGLSREFSITVTAAELQKKLDARIEEVRPQMRLKGFRPGKVPASHVRKMYGKDLLGELINKLVDETNQKTLEENELRPAGQPEVQMDGEIEKVLSGDADLAYQMLIDVMPEFEPVDVSTLTIKRQVADVPSEDIDESLEQIAQQNTKYEPKDDGAKAEDGDAVIVDFVGKIDGEEFDGGKAEQQTVVIGSNRFIPGFEEQLVGVSAGDETELNVTFPEDYAAEDLKGKDAVFEVKVHELRAPETPELNDEFAEGIGLESFDKLKEMVSDQIQSQYDAASRAKAKRNLLDQLDETHSFDLPPKMVDQEFDQIWQQFQTELSMGNVSDEEKDKPEDDLKKEYREIAERRVRLGLVLAEIGQKAEIKISEQEVQGALIAEARKYPGQEREVIEFFQKNAGALAQLRAPIYEDKVVDHILETAKVEEEKVDKDTLFAEDEDEA